MTQCGIVGLSTGRVVLVYKPILCKRRMRPQLGAAYQPSEATNSKFILPNPFHTIQKVKIFNMTIESERFDKGPNGLQTICTVGICANVKLEDLRKLGDLTKAANNFHPPGRWVMKVRVANLQKAANNLQNMKGGLVSINQ